MSESELKAAAVLAVKNAEPVGSKFQATTLIEGFSSGTLVIVDYEDEDEDDVESYVYFVNGRPQVFGDMEGLARFIAGRQKPTFWSLILDTSSVRGVSGIIALILTISLCWTFARSPSNSLSAPPFLTNAWTVMIGFYFGSQTKK